MTRYLPWIGIFALGAVVAVVVFGDGGSGPDPNSAGDTGIAVQDPTLVATGESLYQASCAACHGTDGRSPGAIPSINGKTSDFISQAMHDFREGKRPATVMGRHATGYTDEEIAFIADYFSSQP